ncbi:threonine synthase [Quaeritorhiza haematococci]|nr:threonine synthase [Quaeritorhiza haematococci]
MRYRSTRGKASSKTFEQVLFEGLAPDGGLYIPESIPTVPLQQLLSWATLSFTDLATRIFRLYISETEIPTADLHALVVKSFSTFSTYPDVTPLKKLPNVAAGEGTSNLDNLHVLELFHGPTFAFKDVALQFVGNLFEYFLTRRNAGSNGSGKGASKPSSGGAPHKITVLGATSGDTGGAAIYGLRGKQNTSIFILHPKNRISPVQEAQMTSVLDPNVYNVAVEGTFDDCQEIVKHLFNDTAFRNRFNLAAINSINWARILAQTTYYFYSYFTLLRQMGIVSKNTTPSYIVLTRIQYSVPTGNFGDVLAGYYALRMGLPIHRLIVGTNQNDILHRYLWPISCGLS